MRRMMLPALAALLLVGCEPGATRSAKELVAARLLDPRSAQFEDVVSGDGVVCGRVNAKNRMGGYVGFKRFVVDVAAGSVDMEPDIAGDIRQPEELAKDYAGIIFELEKWARCPSK